MKLENNLLSLSLQRIVRSVALSELRGFLYNKPGFAIGTALPVLLQPRLHCDVSHTASTASLSKQLARGRYSQQEYVEARLVGRDWPAARTLPSELHFVHAARKLHAPPLSQTRRVLGNEADASCVFFSLCSTHCAHLVLTFLLGIVVRLQHGLRLERPQPRPRRSAGLPLRGLSPALRGRPAQRGHCRGSRNSAGFDVALVCVLLSSLASPLPARVSTLTSPLPPPALRLDHVFALVSKQKNAKGERRLEPQKALVIVEMKVRARSLVTSVTLV